MPKYRLIFKKAHGAGANHVVDFDAANAFEAFRLARYGRAPGELWLGNQKICTLQRARGGPEVEVWVISV